ncbi:hypothetical protein B0H66DRAFT_606199 [Apodospora peruviana]|uniref:Serine-threonine rich protein n=1 Tax=Apodospora peruviana TaxID=516989 RepID=A0AAE0HZD6_9PEZI|nr:hypothetical protein B0H66DRAFT_606199 [Apodospora peruviana]
MKFTTALGLGMAPVVLGKSAHNVHPVRRDGEQAKVLDVRTNHESSAVSVNSQSVQASGSQLEELKSLLNLSPGSGIDVVVLWVNVGGGQATTVLNEAQTVTVTQTVNGGGAVATGEAAAPPVENAAGGSATAVAGASGTVASTGATHSVTVGGPQGLAFNPPELAATPGDTVIFTFLSQNHTATQSAFDTPCDPLAGGMDSGFQANPNNTVNPPPQVAMQVMVSTPLWFYCKQANHCGKGMTFSINPTANKTQAMFQALAIKQKGNGGGGAITGNGGAAPPAGEAAAPPAASATVGGAAAATSSGIVQGTGTVGGDGTCVCAVQCSFGGNFPAAQAQGVNNFGGMPGV